MRLGVGKVAKRFAGVLERLVEQSHRTLAAEVRNGATQRRVEPSDSTPQNFSEPDRTLKQDHARTTPAHPMPSFKP